MNTPLPQDQTAVFVDPLIGAQVGQFHIVGRIGAGASGVVYEGWNGTKEQVAIKVLKAEVAHDKEYVTRMMTEARTVAQLRHPAAVHIHTVGLLPDGRPYVVMEYLDGDTLEGWSRTEGEVKIDDVCRLGADVCSVLSAVHAQGVVHRDVKAENIFLARSKTTTSQLKLLDFGIAKVAGNTPLVGQETTPGSFVGTPSVMSPEQIRGERVTAQTDLYALGAVLYRLLTQHDPFEGESLTEVLLQQLSAIAPDPRALRPDTPAPLAALIASLLAKKPADRPASAQVVEAQLRASIGSRPLSDDTLDRATRAGRPRLSPSGFIAEVGDARPAGPADPSPSSQTLVGVGAVTSPTNDTDPLLAGVSSGAITGPTDNPLALSPAEPTLPFPAYVAPADELTVLLSAFPAPVARAARLLPWWPFAVAAAVIVLTGIVFVVSRGAAEPYVPPPPPPKVLTAKTPERKPADPPRPPARPKLTARKVISRADGLKDALRAQQPPLARGARAELNKLRRRATKTSDPEELAAILASLDAWERRYLPR